MSVLGILDVFPRHFNVNGDAGNVLALRRRLDWAGIPVSAASVLPGEAWGALPRPAVVHIGGGSVAAQRAVMGDVAAQAPVLREWLEQGTIVLGVAGGFQLLMTEVTLPGEHSARPGFGVFAGESLPTEERISEFVVVDSPFGLLHGYQNLGQSVRLGAGVDPLGRPRSGTGNLLTPGTEGARSSSAIGSNLHGPLLPKNPLLADWILAGAAADAGFEYVTGPRHARADGYADAGNAVLRDRLRPSSRRALVGQRRR